MQHICKKDSIWKKDQEQQNNFILFWKNKIHKLEQNLGSFKSTLSAAENIT